MCGYPAVVDSLQSRFRGGAASMGVFAAAPYLKFAKCSGKFDVWLGTSNDVSRGRLLLADLVSYSQNLPVGAQEAAGRELCRLESRLETALSGSHHPAPDSVAACWRWCVKCVCV